MAHKSNKVNDVLCLPLAQEFTAKLEALMNNEEDFVLAMVDVDSFDGVNKVFDYDVGDRVLIQTGEHLRAFAGERAQLFRFGGDEFAMVFASMEKEEVFLFMESLRAAYQCPLPDGRRQTISIGIAAFPDDAGTPGELIRKAEGAMFRAKLNGRDRVCLAREEKMVTKTAHYTVEQLKRLTKVSQREGIGEAILLREALDALLKKYDA